jgi:hypothetical protein
VRVLSFLVHLPAPEADDPAADPFGEASRVPDVLQSRSKPVGPSNMECRREYRRVRHVEMARTPTMRLP